MSCLKITIIASVITWLSFCSESTQAAQLKTKTSDTLAVSQYTSYIKSLDPRDLDSVSRARERALALMHTLSQTNRDEVFLNFEQHYRLVVRNHAYLSGDDYATSTLSVDFENMMKKSNSPEIDKALKLHPYYKILRRNGCEIYWPEGDLAIDEHPDYLKSFVRFLSPALADFITIRARERAEGYIEDAGLVISFSQLGSRVATWESYMAKYPNSPYKDKAKDLYESYLGVFMTGVENSRIYDSGSGSLIPEVRKAYESYINEHPDTVTGKLLKNYYNLLSQNNFHKSLTIDRFLEENHVRVLFDGPEK